jgi:hypothetical protein
VIPSTDPEPKRMPASKSGEGGADVPTAEAVMEAVPPDSTQWQRREKRLQRVTSLPGPNRRVVRGPDFTHSAAGRVENAG